MTMAMPTYAMSCFKISKKLCKNLSVLMANFWWDGGNGQEQNALAIIEEIISNEKQGRIGFQGLRGLQQSITCQALLGKQICR